MRAKTRRPALLLPLGVFALTTVWLLSGSRMLGDFRIDEAHKIADTAFFGFLLRSDFRHPDWSRHIADRTNPPVGKYLFGLSVWVHGLELPGSVSIRTELTGGRLGQRLRPEVEAGFTPHLLAVRRVSAIATTLTAALLSWIAYRLQGIAAALITPALYLTQFLTLTFSSTAVYDPLLALFVTATAVPLMLAWQGSESWFAAAAAGLLSALAFQTRLSGAVALLMTIIVFAAIAVRRRSVQPLVKGAAAGAVCLILSTALNPFYWPNLGRYATQFRDAGRLLSGENDVRPGPVEKMKFVTEVVAGDLAGVLMILGLLLTILMMHRRGTARRHQLGFLLLWCGGTTAALLLWLPLAWPRYLLAAIPPLALLSGFGWAELLTQAVQALPISQIASSTEEAAARDRGGP